MAVQLLSTKVRLSSYWCCIFIHLVCLSEELTQSTLCAIAESAFSRLSFLISVLLSHTEHDDFSRIRLSGLAPPVFELPLCWHDLHLT